MPCFLTTEQYSSQVYSGSVQNVVRFGSVLKQQRGTLFTDPDQPRLCCTLTSRTLSHGICAHMA